MTRRSGARAPWFAAALTAAVAGWSTPSSADTPENTFRDGVAALENGDFERAILQFEELSASDFVHPDASYNRGAAYLARAVSPQAKPGDLGRASAAFREALLLRSGDDAAEHALEEVRKEVARRRATSSGTQMTYDESLFRALVTLVPEDVWSGLALVGSLLSAAGFSLLLWVRRSNTRVPAWLCVGVGSSLLLLCGVMTACARHFRVTEALAVVVVPEARLLDEHAVPRAAGREQVVPEGAEVRVSEDKGGALVKVAWGQEQAWVLRNQLKFLARP